MNLVSKLFIHANQSPDRPALWVRTFDQYHAISWRDLGDKISTFSAGLFQLGVRRGDRVAILSENRPEWVITDMGVMSLGAVVVPIYPTASLPDIAHILKDSESTILCISSIEQLLRIQSNFSILTKPLQIVLFDTFTRDQFPNVLSFDSLIRLGSNVLLNSPDLIRETISQISESDLATIIYTSGTTGAAKGVMLTHGNFLANEEGCRKRISVSHEDITISFLPLSHVFERLAGYYFMLFSGASIAYARSMQTVIEDMQMIHPTVAPAVPRFYEKVYHRILDAVQHASTVRRKLFQKAIVIGSRVRAGKLKNERLSLTDLLLYKILDILVLKKIRAVFGGRIRFFISGGAPLSKEIGEFFFACGVLILEGYGLTETSPVIAVNAEENFKFGTVGQPLINCEVKIAEDGEILLKGPSVMRGYYRDEVATHEVLREGWFSTGDIGHIDSDGFLKITDRKKDIIKTSGGKMVAPQNIEKMILADPLYSQIVILGDQRQYLVAFIVPNQEHFMALSRSWKLPSMSWAELLKRPEVLDFFKNDLRQKTEALASFEQIKYFELIPEEFSVEKGELTPTLKVKRRFIQEKLKSQIDRLYDSNHLKNAQ